MDEKLTVDVDTVVYFDWEHQREVGERKILKTLSDIYQRKNFAEKLKQNPQFRQPPMTKAISL